jgi:NAD(P)H dehydrogenase (quinone)
LNTLVVHCHPDPESFNAALFRAACEALEGAGHELRRADLYAEGFDPVLSLEERRVYLVDPGFIEARVQAHVDALRWAEHIVFVFPTWFYGPPAVLKGWLERVWLPGVAFVPSKVRGKPPTPGLQHVLRLTVVTTSGSPWWWIKVMGDPVRKLFRRGLQALFARGCRTTWLQLYDMNNVTREDCTAFLGKVSRTLGAMK